MAQEKGPREWSPRWNRWVAIKINAGHDTNGNPRRGWLIVDAMSGNQIDFVDEGYRGWAGLKHDYPDVVEGPELVVTPGEYRDQVRFGREQAEKHKRGEI